MDARLRKMLEEGKISWNRAKDICRKILAASPDKEKEAADRLIEQLEKNKGGTKKTNGPCLPEKP